MAESRKESGVNMTEEERKARDREYQKQYAITHREQIRERNRKYREIHKDEIREYQKQYRENKKPVQRIKKQTNKHAPCNSPNGCFECPYEDCIRPMYGSIKRTQWEQDRRNVIKEIMDRRREQK